MAQIVGYLNQRRSLKQRSLWGPELAPYVVAGNVFIRDRHL